MPAPERRNLVTRAALVASALVVLIAPGCGGDSASSNTDAARSTATAPAASTTPRPDGCGTHSLGYDLETKLCPGHVGTDAGASTSVEMDLPKPSRQGLKWFGGLFSATDIQVREAPKACDGCEVGVVEVVVAKSESSTLKTLRGLSNLHGLKTSKVDVGGRSVTRLSGQFRGRTSHAFGGIEFSPGPLNAYVVPAGKRAGLVLVGGKPLTPFLTDARKVIASLEVH